MTTVKGTVRAAVVTQSYGLGLASVVVIVPLQKSLDVPSVQVRVGSLVVLRSLVQNSPVVPLGNVYPTPVRPAKNSLEVAVHDTEKSWASDRLLARSYGLMATDAATAEFDLPIVAIAWS